MSSRNLPIGVIAAQLLAQQDEGGGPGPGGGTGPWTFDSRYLDADHSLADGGKTAQNDTASLNNNTISTSQIMSRADANTYYWEFDITGGDGSVSGAVGVSAVNDLPNFETQVLGEAGGMGYGGTTIVHNGGNVATGLPGFGTPDLVMMAFKPSTGEMWVGLNGTWEDDPDVDAATATASTVADFWRVAVCPTDPNRVITLLSESAEFNYSVPAACTPLENCAQPEELKVDAMTVVTVTGPFPPGHLGVRSMRVITVVEE